MRITKLAGLFLTTLLMISCSNEEGSHPPETTAIINIGDISDSNTAVDSAEKVFMQVVLNTVNMRQSPSMDSEVVGKLAADSDIEWLNEVSNVIAPVTLRGVRYNDPWLYVRSPEDKMGWVYAATVKITTTNAASAELKQVLFTRRIETFFGNNLANAIKAYGIAYAQAKTSTDFANVYTTGLGLRDKIVPVLERKVVVKSEALADMSWLDKLLPGYTHARVAEGTAYYLFADFPQWQAKAKQTPSDEDDQFIKLYMSIFPDGQESFFPVWITQTTDYRGDSRLGSGIHKAMLDTIENMVTETPVYMHVLLSVKQELVKDITQPGSTFTQLKEKKVDELNAILKAGYSILNKADTEALQRTLSNMSAN